VQAMGLTWRDLVSSVTVLAMIMAYAAFALRTTTFPLLSTAWGASIVELVLGSLCAATAAGDLHLRPQPPQGVIFRRITTVLGSIALVAALTGFIANNRQAVEIVVVTTTFLWLTAFIWHVLSIGSPGNPADGSPQ
jgi:hypothetical protein